MGRLTKSRLGKPYRRRPGYEALESRRLLAVATDLVNLTGRVFDDFTGDGFTAGEQVAAATVTLYRDSNNNGQFEPSGGDAELRSTTTAADGRYEFTRLDAGQYFVLQPAQTVAGKPLQQSVSPLITVTAEQVAGRLIRTIDGFDGNQQSVVDEISGDGPVTSTAAAPEAIGGSRDLIVEKTSDIGSVSLVVNDPVSPNLLQVRSTAFGGGRRVVIWDGAGDDAAIVNDDGLGSIDLTSGGEAAGLRLVVGADLPAGAAIVRLYTNDNAAGTRTRVSSATLAIPQTTTQPTSIEFLPFSSFTTATGATGPADLSDIGAIEFEVVAMPNYDALADLIGTIGPNVIPVAEFDNFESIDLNLTQELITTTPNVDGLVSFRLLLRNEGDDTATNIVVTDTLPAGISYRSNQAAAGTAFNPTGGLWTIGSLAPGGTASLVITGLLTTGEPQTNTAEVTAVDQFDADSTPNNNIAGEDDQASAIVTASQINLSLSKTVSPNRPNVGESVAFTLILTNSGINDATNIVVQDRLPTGFAATGTGPGGSSFNPATAQWVIQVLAAGQSTTLTLNSTVPRAGSFSNVAEVIAADQFDINSTPANNLPLEDDQDSADFQTPAADLSIEKTVVGQVASIGDNVNFTITLNNAGPDPATNVRVREILPAGLVYQTDATTLGDYDPQTGIWTLPNLPVTTPGSTPVTLTLTAAVTTAGTKTNVAEIIAADQSDPDSTPGNGSAAAAGQEDDIDSVMITPVTIDLELEKTVSQPRPIPGQSFAYNLTVRNTSTDNASGVVVTDPIPEGLIFQTATDGEAFNSNGGVWIVGDVLAGASRTIAINVLLDPARQNPLAAISNIAQITAADQFDNDSTPGNNLSTEDDQDSVSITPARADLSLVKTALNPNADVGEEISFTITVRNDGPDPSGSFVVADPIPARASFVRAETPTGTTYDPGNQQWTVDSLTSGQTRTLTLVLRSTASGSINNVAQIISASLPDPDSTPGNGVAAEDDQDDASVDAEQIDLSLSKQVDITTPRTGETFRYTITVTNSGPDTATNIVVGETLPETITLVANDPETGSFVTSNRRWTIPSLAPNTSTRLFLDARIAASAINDLTPGDPVNTGLVNTAEILSVDQSDVDSTPGNNLDGEDDQDSASVRVLIADVSVEKNTLTPAPNAGDTARFEVIVRNDGPDAATNLVVRDLLPAGLTYRSDSQSDAASDYAPTTGLWTIPSLAAGQSVRLQINADVSTSGTFTNTAELIALDQDDPDSRPDNNLASEDDQSSDSLTTPVIDLAITQTAAPERPTVGGETTFTLTLTNTGPSDATEVRVRDTLPENFRFLDSNPPAIFNAITGIWNIDTLASGATTQLEIRGTVLSAIAMTNGAEVVAAAQFDRDSTPDNGFDNNEDDQASIVVTPASADLSLTKTVSSPEPNVGSDVTFTLTVRNDGPDTAENIEVLDSLPQGLSNLRGTTPAGIFNVDDSVWRIPELRSGTSVTLTLIATIDFDANNNPLPIVRTNYAEIIASSQFDPDSTPNNNSGNNNDNDEDDDASVEFTPQLIDLALTKTLDRPRVNVGETIEYRVTVSNDGPSDADNVVIEDRLPTGLTFVSSTPDIGSAYSQPTGRWTIPLIPAGESRELVLRATVAPNANNIDTILSEGILNIAEVIAADQPDRDSTPNNGDTTGEDDYATAALTIARADLSLDKSVDVTEPDQGDTVTFLVNVNNEGPDTATNIVVRDVLPIGLTDVQVTTASGAYNAATGRWTIESLPTGSTATLQIQARVVTSDVITNTAEIVAVDQFDPDSVPDNGLVGEDDLGAATVTPRVVDVSVTAELAPTQANTGDTVQLVVTVRNGDPILRTLSTLSTRITPLASTTPRLISDATGVVVGIPIPAGLTLLGTDPTGVYAPVTGRWNVGGLAAGTSQQLTLSFLVDSPAVRTFEIEVLETNEFDLDSTVDNNVATEDDQTAVTLFPPRVISVRLFLSR